MHAFLLVGALTVAVPDRPDPTPKGEMPLPKMIQGEWQVVVATVNGNPNGVIKAGQSTFRFDGDTMILRLNPGNKMEYRYQYSIEAAKSPATFDFALGMSKTARKSLGIVKIEGDLLTICYHFTGDMTRPAEFVSRAGSKSAVWQMRRVRK